MLQTHFPAVLRWTGAITALGGLQMLLPAGLLAPLGLTVGDASGLLFMRHWGVLVAAFGVLILMAGGRPELQRPIVTAALVEKLALLVLLAQNWSEPGLRGLQPALAFDGLCVLLYGVWLLGGAQAGRKPSTDR